MTLEHDMKQLVSECMVSVDGRALHPVFGRVFVRS